MSELKKQFKKAQAKAKVAESAEEAAYLQQIHKEAAEDSNWLLSVGHSDNSKCLSENHECYVATALTYRPLNDKGLKIYPQSP